MILMQSIDSDAVHRFWCSPSILMQSIDSDAIHRFWCNPSILLQSIVSDAIHRFCCNPSFLMQSIDCWCNPSILLQSIESDAIHRLCSIRWLLAGRLGLEIPNHSTLGHEEHIKCVTSQSGKWLRTYLLINVVSLNKLNSLSSSYGGCLLELLK